MYYLYSICFSELGTSQYNKERITRKKIRTTLDFNGAEESLVCCSFSGGFVIFFTGVCW